MQTDAQKLFQAYQSHEPLELGKVKAKTMDEGYKVQDAFVALKEENGEKLAGYKISMTSDETMAIFGSPSPVYGAMTDKQVLSSELSLSDWNAPLVEMELVFLVHETILPDDTPEEVMEKCTVAPGLEVPDARYKDWFPHADLAEVVSDAAVSGGILYGSDHAMSYEEVKKVEASLTHQDEVLGEGKATDVLGHPAKAVLWLAEELDKHGKSLSKGLFVSSGTFTMPYKLEVGEYVVDYSNVGSLKLTVTK